MEKGTPYIEYTTKALISVTNTSHADVDEHDVKSDNSSRASLTS